MPRDVELAREIAHSLRDVYKHKINRVEFTYNAYIEFDRIEPNDSICILSPQSYTRVRETRSDFRHETEIVLTLVSPVAAHSRQKDIDDWLDSWDGMLDFLENLKINNRKVITGIDVDQRYDANLFHSYNRLVTQAVLQSTNLTGS